MRRRCSHNDSLGLGKKENPPGRSYVPSPGITSKFPFAGSQWSPSISSAPESFVQWHQNFSLEERPASLLIFVAFQIYLVPSDQMSVLINECDLQTEMQLSLLGNFPWPEKGLKKPRPRGFISDSISNIILTSRTQEPSKIRRAQIPGFGFTSKYPLKSSSWVVCLLVPHKGEARGLNPLPPPLACSSSVLGL